MEHEGESHEKGTYGIQKTGDLAQEEAKGRASAATSSRLERNQSQPEQEDREARGNVSRTKKKKNINRLSYVFESIERFSIPVRDFVGRLVIST